MVFYYGTFPTGTALAGVRRSRSWSAALAFAALALALTAVIPNADAAPPIVNASILPAAVPLGDLHPARGRHAAWIRSIGAVFPVKHFADAMRAAYLSKVHGADAGRPGPRVPVRMDAIWWSIALWGVAGLVLAARYFSWEPRR